MPANLTPQYRKAEERYRQAQTSQERVQCLERMLQLIPRHKGTDRLQGDLRARLKEVRAELAAEQSIGKPGRSYRIPRQGAGTAVIIGAPNAGKSRLLKELTGALPEVAPYPFTTREPQAGMMVWEDLQIQLIDTPPIFRNFVEAYLTSFIRSADLVVLCVDGSDEEAIQSTLDVIDELKARKTELFSRSGFREDDYSIVQVQTLCVLLHGNDENAETRLELLRQSRSLQFPMCHIELDFPEDVARVRTVIAKSLPILRIYTRRPGESRADRTPTTLPLGATVTDLALKIHADLVSTLKFAKVWSAGHTAGRPVNRDYELQDLDMVELHT